MHGTWPPPRCSSYGVYPGPHALRVRLPPYPTPGPEVLMRQVALAVAALNDQLAAPAAVLHQVAHEL